MKARCFLLLSLSLYCASLVGQPVPLLTPLTESFSQPVDLTAANDGTEELYVVEKGGRVFRYRPATAEKTLFLDLAGRVLTRSEGGLLGLTFHPRFPDSSYCYVNYTVAGPSNAVPMVTRVSRFRVGPDRLPVANSELVLLSLDQPAANHNAGDLAFGPDGYLYVPTGDGGGANDRFDNGQAPRSLLGKLLRLDVDGATTQRPYRIPPDNPFVGNPDTLAEIWALGLRNPWRISFDRATGDLWIGDVGQVRREEIDFQPAGSPGGQNYGWNCREGFLPFGGASARYCRTGAGPYVAPELDYPRSGNGGFSGESVTGGFVYRGPAADLNGYYVFGDYVNSRIFLYRRDAPAGERLLVFSDPGVTRITTFGEGNDGRLYVAGIGGRVYEITAETATPTTAAPAGSSDLRAFPNPARDRLSLTVPLAPGSPVTLRLFAADGRRVVERHGSVGAEGGLALRLPPLAGGVYTVVLTAAGRQLSTRIVID